MRPWDQDERPTWRAVAEWGSPREHYDVDDLRLLAKVLEETGMTRQVMLQSGVGELRVSMLVKAVDVVAAEHAAVKIVEVAYTVAGLGHLGMNLSSRATRLRRCPT
jgi:hypothetical protein